MFFIVLIINWYDVFFVFEIGEGLLLFSLWILIWLLLIVCLMCVIIFLMEFCGWMWKLIVVVVLIGRVFFLGLFLSMVGVIVVWIVVFVLGEVFNVFWIMLLNSYVLVIVIWLKNGIFVVNLLSILVWILLMWVGNGFLWRVVIVWVKMVIVVFFFGMDECFFFVWVMSLRVRYFFFVMLMLVIGCFIFVIMFLRIVEFLLRENFSFMFFFVRWFVILFVFRLFSIFLLCLKVR